MEVAVPLSFDPEAAAASRQRDLVLVKGSNDQRAAPPSGPPRGAPGTDGRYSSAFAPAPSLPAPGALRRQRFRF